jgi:hypothetical protein
MRSPAFSVEPKLLYSIQKQVHVIQSTKLGEFQLGSIISMTTRNLLTWERTDNRILGSDRSLDYDAIVIGGGFFGCKLALYLKEQLDRVVTYSRH